MVRLCSPRSMPPMYDLSKPASTARDSCDKPDPSLTLRIVTPKSIKTWFPECLGDGFAIPRPRNRPRPIGLYWSAVVTNSAKVRLPNKLSLLDQGSVWAESCECPNTNHSFQLQKKFNSNKNSNSRIKLGVNVLKQILERLAKKDLWKHKRVARLAIDTPRTNSTISQIACHEFKQTKSGVGKIYHLENSSPGCNFFVAKKKGMQAPFGQTAATSNQPYSARSLEPSTPGYPAGEKMLVGC